MKNNKPPGNDNITKELEACGDVGINKLAKIINKIYESRCIPQQMKEKDDLLNYSNYRLISLMSHITKILIRIIMTRMKKVIHTENSWEQFGFRKKQGYKKRNLLHEFHNRKKHTNATRCLCSLY